LLIEFEKLCSSSDQKYPDLRVVQAESSFEHQKGWMPGFEFEFVCYRRSNWRKGCWQESHQNLQN
jgi:hypothetical protein